MGVLAEFHIPAESFLLSKTLPAFPSATVEVARFVHASTDGLLPTFTVYFENLDAFDDALRSDPTVASVVSTYRGDQEAVYCVQWTDAKESTVRNYLEAGAALLDARSSGEEWRLRISFRDGKLSEFQSFCRANDLEFELSRLDRLEDSQLDGRYDLTPPQRRVLTAALERGYYEIPRAVSMTELADELGVSQQALSERLRRAQARLVRATLA